MVSGIALVLGLLVVLMLSCFPLSVLVGSDLPKQPGCDGLVLMAFQTGIKAINQEAPVESDLKTI